MFKSSVCCVWTLLIAVATVSHVSDALVHPVQVNVPHELASYATTNMYMFMKQYFRGLNFRLAKQPVQIAHPVQIPTKLVAPVVAAPLEKVVPASILTQPLELGSVIPVKEKGPFVPEQKTFFIQPPVVPSSLQISVPQVFLTENKVATAKFVYDDTFKKPSSVINRVSYTSPIVATIVGSPPEKIRIDDGDDTRYEPPKVTPPAPSTPNECTTCNSNVEIPGDTSSSNTKPIETSPVETTKKPEVETPPGLIVIPADKLFDEKPENVTPPKIDINDDTKYDISSTTPFSDTKPDAGQIPDSSSGSATFIDDSPFDFSIKPTTEKPKMQDRQDFGIEQPSPFFPTSSSPSKPEPHDPFPFAPPPKFHTGSDGNRFSVPSGPRPQSPLVPAGTLPPPFQTNQFFPNHHRFSSSISSSGSPLSRPNLSHTPLPGRQLEPFPPPQSEQQRPNFNANVDLPSQPRPQPIHVPLPPQTQTNQFFPNNNQFTLPNGQQSGPVQNNQNFPQTPDSSFQNSGPQQNLPSQNFDNSQTNQRPNLPPPPVIQTNQFFPNNNNNNNRFTLPNNQQNRPTPTFPESPSLPNSGISSGSGRPGATNPSQNPGSQTSQLPPPPVFQTNQFFPNNNNNRFTLPNNNNQQSGPSSNFQGQQQSGGPQFNHQPQNPGLPAPPVFQTNQFFPNNNQQGQGQNQPQPNQNFPQGPFPGFPGGGGPGGFQEPENGFNPFFMQENFPEPPYESEFASLPPDNSDNDNEPTELTGRSQNGGSRDNPVPEVTHAQSELRNVKTEDLVEIVSKKPVPPSCAYNTISYGPDGEDCVQKKKKR